MNTMNTIRVALGAALLAGALGVQSVNAQTTEGAATAAPTTTAPTAESVMKQAHMNLFYPADDGRAVVHMELTDKRGKSRSRDFIMLRLDVEDGGEQKYYTWFTGPSDVKRTSFMVWKDPVKDDSRWIYIPALDLVKRISANDKASSFVGSDFSYEDVSGRHWSDDVHTLVREEEQAGDMAWVVESTPKEKDSFAKKITWVSKEKMLPLREEYFNDKGELERVFTAEGFVDVDGIISVTKRTMTNEKKNHKTVVEFSEISYDVGIEDDIFTERYLKAPPKALLEGEGS
ncbi:MAG: outer membrane lipoprotein-sorting protein [Gemmatimonadetes bacterium]|nr:outer membrane lipoprotein-sorting protein [Gemmatimonadota bacterium]